MIPFVMRVLADYRSPLAEVQNCRREYPSGVALTMGGYWAGDVRGLKSW